MILEHELRIRVQVGGVCQENVEGDRAGNERERRWWQGA